MAGFICTLITEATFHTGRFGRDDIIYLRTNIPDPTEEQSGDIFLSFQFCVPNGTAKEFVDRNFAGCSDILVDSNQAPGSLDNVPADLVIDSGQILEAHHSPPPASPPESSALNNETLQRIRDFVSQSTNVSS